LLVLLGGAMTTAHTLGAQQKAMPVIGFLNSGSPGSLGPYLVAFRHGLECAPWKGTFRSEPLR
jgi:hypothetical protein